jgi:hypothetical protein
MVQMVMVTVDCFKRNFMTTECMGLRPVRVPVVIYSAFGKSLCT